MLSLISLLIVAALGLEHLAYPLYGDQALFAVGAMKMQHGAVLYRDFWDLKQPGIYVFYLLGGSLFGFSERGIHFFELLYMLAFAVVLQQTSGAYFRSPLTSAVLPLFVVGFYYANAVGATGMTQVEAIVGFPLYLSVYFVAEGVRRGRAWPFVLAGALGAAVLALKLIFLPLVVLAWAAALWAAHAREHARWNVRELGVLAGSLVVATAAWLVPTSLAAGPALVFETFFRDPAWIVRAFPSPPLHRLIEAFSGYLASALALLILALFGLAREPKLARNPLWLASAAWLAIGTVVIVAQRQSWWGYQTQLLIVPVGVLAAFGVEALATWFASARGMQRFWRVACAALILLLAGADLMKHSATEARTLAVSHFALSESSRQKFASLIDPLDARRVADASFLRDPGVRKGDIYVVGSPVYYLGASRLQAVAVNGWSTDLLAPDERRRLFAELSQAQPPYVFVARDYRGFVAGGNLAAWIANRYRPMRTTADGVWYELGYLSGSR